MRIRAAAVLLAFTTIPGPAISGNATAAQTAPTASSPATPATAAGQARQTLTVTNYSGHTIVTLSVSPTGTDSRSQDILGGANLDNGESAQISFPRDETQCNFDIRATYGARGIISMRDLDLCQIASVALTAD